MITIASQTCNLTVLNMAKKTMSSQEIGLELGIIWGKYLYGVNHLHYGMWDDDLELKLENFNTAQERYCEFLKSQIPDGVKTILDVGCGTGAFLYELSKAGYEVEGVTPSVALIREPENYSGKKPVVYEALYENFEIEKKYDLILFSESYQYIDIEDGLNKSLKLLNDNGYILLCDFFKVDKLSVDGKSPMSGGHKIVKFDATIKNFPIKELKRIDITKKMAPNIDIVNDMLTNIAIPSVRCAMKYIESKWFYRLVSKVVRWLFRKKLAKIERKYLSGERNGKNFLKYKRYLLILFQKT